MLPTPQDLSPAETTKSRPGRPCPLGATWDPEGVNFALFSEKATNVSLCLFSSAEPQNEVVLIPLERTGDVWHVYVEALVPGQLYGYRLDGLYDPAQGSYFNSYKVVLDPYARAIYTPADQDVTWLGYASDDSFKANLFVPSRQDSGPSAPKSIVVDPAFNWEDDQAPAIPLSRSVIYELHVKGFTIQHPAIDPAIRGSYTALGSAESITYLKKLGVTAIELMPIHQFIGQSYWGYNTIGFFAPHSGYTASVAGHSKPLTPRKATDVVVEFKTMVKALHRANIEVILDVVYNHTAEGNQYGPTLSLKGIDNQAYYRLAGDNPEGYEDYTGTGNTLNLNHPQTLQLVMDSLHYWVTEMHVDGFRFDLATVLARGQDPGELSSFLEAVRQDAVLKQVKLIAEPWDIKAYHVGDFPVGWSEWNGKFRDCVRSFWKGDPGQAAELSLRLLGSPDLYADDRQPGNSINLITAHDGFTLHDLVSYNDKHNEANGENNQDGSSYNLSWNCGTEGPTDDKAVNALRAQQQRNFLTTLFFSQGTPMLSMGDEYGRTQHGNNNAYNQDNALNWFNWNWTDNEQAQFDFTVNLIALRQQFSLLREKAFYTQHQATYLRPDGLLFSTEDLNNPAASCIALLLEDKPAGDQVQIDEPLLPARPLLWILNSNWEDITFKLPDFCHWEVVIDTATTSLRSVNEHPYAVASRSSVLLRAV